MVDTENGHTWHERVFAFTQIKCCMNCGFIKNEKQPNKPCPSPIGVELRADTPLDQALREAVDRLAQMSPEEQAAHWEAQRQSFVRGMMARCEHGELDFEECPRCRDGVRKDQP